MTDLRKLAALRRAATPGHWPVDVMREFASAPNAAYITASADWTAEELEALADVVEALADANRIIAMTRDHLHADHPDCAYDVLGIMNDGSRRAALDRLQETTP